MTVVKSQAHHLLTFTFCSVPFSHLLFLMLLTYLLPPQLPLLLSLLYPPALLLTNAVDGTEIQVDLGCQKVVVVAHLRILVMKEKAIVILTLKAH